MKNYFFYCENLKDVKLLYRDLAFEFHPLHNSFSEDLKELDFEYISIILPIMIFSQSSIEDRRNCLDFTDIIKTLITAHDITIETVGASIWVYGNTTKYQQELKKAFFMPSDIPDHFFSYRYDKPLINF